MMRATRILALAAAFGALCGAAHAAGPFTLTSPSFKDGAMMPLKFAGSTATNPNCVGGGQSPALAWTDIPDGTKSLAVMMIDPEGRGGLGVTHWVAYGVAPTVAGFAEGEVSKPSPKYVGGKNQGGFGWFTGPCTPPGTSLHHYTCRRA